ncbi:ecto-ADP-ribosyltransferase 3 [Phodopus roborovskii]|uniref:ecto-ADP-ribosyltransferase 3 n=1 Tax=Phodopus roborovskii TaxID=109678 RepID=UPI0021E422CB|nr:ecto-ADP-ribosyltransferase 3 [Phodopus roborovskii]
MRNIFTLNSQCGEAVMRGLTGWGSEWPRHHLNSLQRHKHQKRKVKMGHLEMVTTLLAAMTLMDIFQVKAEVLDMAENSFDDEYPKCSNRMEMKFVPQLLREEIASHELLQTVWDNAGIMWEARKAQIPLPLNFKDSYGIALMAFVTEAREQTPFYHEFNRAVKMAGQSRKSYVYDFPFKAFHFYLTRALQVLRKPCEDSYKDTVYLTSPGISFTFGEKNQARLGNFTLAYSVTPPTANSQPVLTIHTCFGVAVERFFDKESERVVLIPLSEVFQVSREGTGKNLTLHSINKTCSYYDCSFLGGLKTENCVANPEYIEPVYAYNPDLESQKLEDSVPGIKPWAPCKLGRKRLESTGIPGIKVLQPDENPFQPDEKPEEKSQGKAANPTPGPAPGPGPKSHPSASSGRMLLPSITASIMLIVASAVSIPTAHGILTFI